MSLRRCARISPAQKSLLKWGLVLALILALSAPAYADWLFYRQVQMRNADKHHLRFDRSWEAPIRAWLILRSQKYGNLKERRPLYKVDDGPVRDLEGVKGVRTHKRGRWINWEIEDGKGEPDSALKEFMNGKEVLFQFYGPDGMIRETVFELEGIKKAVGKLLE